MGTIKNHLPVKLFFALTYQAVFNLDELYRRFEDHLTPIERMSEPFVFSSFTDYYRIEMGDNLNKHFVLFSGLIDPAELPPIKIWTNRVEASFFIDNKRSVNIDPGYITQAKLVLATTKNYSHRLYLAQGIFGDVHMHYSNGSYRPNPWTYPDYMNPLNIAFFNQVRADYIQQLAASGQ